MGILNKENLKKAIKNPFLFVIVILLVVLALGESFAVWCLIGAVIAIPVALMGIDSNKVVFFFCHGDSWKLEAMNNLSNFLGKNTLGIVILSLVAWWLLNNTSKGKEIISLLD